MRTAGSLIGMDSSSYDALVEQALREDLGEEGDVTSSAILGDETAEALLMSKDTGILAGSALFARVFEKVDPRTEVDFHYADGQALKLGDRVASVRGKAAFLLSAERVALNFICFLSGVATAAHLFAETARKHGGARILDTRKTLPGYRELSKYAVRACQ